MTTKKKLPQIIGLNEYTEKTAKDATLAVMRLVDAYESQVGKGTGGQLIGAFLQTFVGTAVFSVLTREQRAAQRAGREAGPEEADRTMDAYRNFKIDVQEAIATAFGDASFQFSGRNVDFYCQIQPIPEPANVEPC